MIRLCMIGCGAIARQHLKAMQMIENTHITVTSLVDPNETAARSLKELLHQDDHCKIFSTLEDANKYSSYDVALIMVPHDLHVQYAIQCLQSGKHIFLEKPVSHTIEGCIELMKAAESTDKIIMIAENARFWPEVVRAKQLIIEGAIGEPYFAQANYWESVGTEDFYDGSMPEWVRNPKQVGGGILMAGTIHWIRSLRILLGDIDEVIGIVSHPWIASQGESLSHALIKFKSGLPGVVHSHMMDIPMSQIPFFQIFGSEGEITIHGDFNGGITIRNKTNPTGVTMETLGGYMESFPPQMLEFISAVKDGHPLTKEHGGSVWNGSQDVMVAKAIYKSLHTKKWEKPTLENLRQCDYI